MYTEEARTRRWVEKAAEVGYVGARAKPSTEKSPQSNPELRRAGVLRLISSSSFSSAVCHSLLPVAELEDSARRQHKRKAPGNGDAAGARLRRQHKAAGVYGSGPESGRGAMLPWVDPLTKLRLGGVPEESV